MSESKQNETLSQGEAQVFRRRCRAFFDGLSPVGDGDTLEHAKNYLRELHAAGLAGLVYANEHGGAGLTKEHDRIFREEKSQQAVRDGEFVISHGMCLPVLNDFGTEEQKRRFMPDNISGNTMWCQMFSEPDAGSDVASLQTKAERDGDEWVINGQKVWTTLAHRSDYVILIARTNPDVVKHAGISMFIVDMLDPNVEIRPIHQIDGGTHFNEVFFTNTRVPVENLVGELNNGWNQATAMLMYERVAIGSLGGRGGINQPQFASLLALAQENGKVENPVVRDQLMRLYAMETTKAMVALRSRAEVKAGKAPGPAGSLGKLLGSEIAWRYREIAQSIAGPSTIAWEEGAASERVAKTVLNSFQAGIAGGTDEIQRNIIGDRVLGLPRDTSVDKGVPFNELKVGTQN